MDECKLNNNTVIKKQSSKVNPLKSVEIELITYDNESKLYKNKDSICSINETSTDSEQEDNDDEGDRNRQTKNSIIFLRQRFISLIKKGLKNVTSRSFSF